MLWYWSTRAPASVANAAVIGDGSAKWKIVTSPRRAAGIGERPHVAAQVVVDRQREDVGVVAPAAEQVAHAPRAVADRVAAMRRRHPLVDDHCAVRSAGLRAPARDSRAPALPASVGSAWNTAGRNCRSSSSRSNWSNCAQKSHATSGAGARRRLLHLVDEAEQRAAEVLRAAAARAPRPALRAPRPRPPASSSTASISRAISQRILRVVEHAAAVHRRRHRRRRVGEHRDALVERLDERHAEAFVLAGAEEQIGDVVERRQLLVRDLPEEVHVGRAEPRDQRRAASPGSARSRRTSRRAAAATADCAASGRRGRRG